jgi:hypothetical protein
MKKIKDIEFKIYSFFRNQDTDTPWIAILLKKNWKNSSTTL